MLELLRHAFEATQYHECSLHIFRIDLSEFYTPSYIQHHYDNLHMFPEDLKHILLISHLLQIGCHDFHGNLHIQRSLGPPLHCAYHEHSFDIFPTDQPEEMDCRILSMLYLRGTVYMF